MESRLILFIVVLLAVGWGLRWQLGRLDLHDGDVVKLVSRVSVQPALMVDAKTKVEYQWVWVDVGSELIGFRLDAWPRVNYGDKVEVLGELGVWSDEVAWFDHHQWLLEVSDFNLIEPNQGVIIQLKNRVLDFYRRSLPYKESGLLAGMVLGVKGELPERLERQMRLAGVTHVVVASGFNVMLLAGMVSSLLLGCLSRVWVSLISGVIVWLYVLLVGFEPPVVRAALMASLSLLAVITGRVRNVEWIFVLSAGLMVWWRPTWVFNLGWQLSVAATAGLLWLKPWMEKLVGMSFDERGAVMRYIGDAGMTTLAAQLAVLPLLLHTFSSIAWLGLLVNVGLLWMVPLITMMGLGMAWLSLIVGGLAGLGLWCVWPLLWLFVTSCEVFGQEWGTVEWQISGMGVVGFYVVLIVVMRLFPIKKNV